MATTISLADSTSELCTSLLDNVRSLRFSAALSAYHLTKAAVAHRAPLPALREMTDALRYVEKSLLDLRGEIEASLSLVDLADLSYAIIHAIDDVSAPAMRVRLNAVGRDNLTELYSSVHELYDQAVFLAEACGNLDDQDCPDRPVYQRGNDISDFLDTLTEADSQLAFLGTLTPTAAPTEATWAASLPATAVASLLDQMTSKIDNDGRRCPICFEDMAESGASGPAITRCGHVFCGECIELAVNEQGKCPMCRGGIQDISFVGKQ